MSKSNIIPSPCKICGFNAFYSYYGVIACESCKMFFKRNAENKKKTLKCYYDGKCQVNINNRHVCSACRLEKCLEVGMRVELIRSSHTHKKRKLNKSLKLVQTTNQEHLQTQQLTTLNLLEGDQSLLTIDQWNLLSNLIQSYDEHNALSIAKNFMKELDGLHPKLRYKIDSKKVIKITTTFYDVTETFILSNNDFTSLSLNDRLSILRGAVDNLTWLGGCFIMRQSGLHTNSAFGNGLEITYGSIPYNLTLNIISSLDQDINLVKLGLSIFAFCTNHCTLFNENISFNHPTNTQVLLCIQNVYAEVIWKYLLYKCTFGEAVKRFSYLVKCLVIALTIRTYVQNVTNHTDVLEPVVQRIEQQIKIEDN